MAARKIMRLLCASFVGLVVIYLLQSIRRRLSVAQVEETYQNSQYFHDTVFYSHTTSMGLASHHDARFAPLEGLTPSETQSALRDLLESFTMTMSELGLEFWIAYGTLLGWYWNRKLLPWDTDIDVQLASDTLRLAGAAFNMSRHQHTVRNGTKEVTYLLEVNQYYSSMSPDPANKIDARWIDTVNGKFIDITGTWSDGAEGLKCKDGHQFQISDIYPLRRSVLEGLKILVPCRSEELLTKEYGRQALHNGRFYWHYFNDASQEWLFEG